MGSYSIGRRSSLRKDECSSRLKRSRINFSSPTRSYKRRRSTDRSNIRVIHQRDKLSYIKDTNETFINENKDFRQRRKPLNLTNKLISKPKKHNDTKKDEEKSKLISTFKKDFQVPFSTKTSDSPEKLNLQESKNAYRTNKDNFKNFKSNSDSTKITSSKECNLKNINSFNGEQLEKAKTQPNVPLDMQALGKLSKEIIQTEKSIKLPDSRNYSFEKEKDQYYKNMYKLIVTARSEINKREEEIETLKIRLNARNSVSCPSCSHKFSTNKSRFLPKYVKILQSTNRVELQFHEMNHLKEWLILNNLDTDKNDIPVLIPKQIDPKFLTLFDVNSSLLTGSHE